jgi:hypothetical protein
MVLFMRRGKQQTRYKPYLYQRTHTHPTRAAQFSSPRVRLCHRLFIISLGFEYFDRFPADDGR